MAKTTSELKSIVARFREELERSGIRCEKIFLYGSYAHGKPREGSDIDLIVVSQDWERFSSRERLEQLGITAARILEPIQAQGFTPDEIARHQILPLWEMILQREAVVI